MESKSNIQNNEVKQWKALYVNSRAEKKVMEMLLAKNIEAYVPIIKTMRQWSDRKKMVEIPLFNGYVFVYIDNNQLDKVLQTRGIVSFVRNGGKIAVVRNEEIERLKQIVMLGYDLEISTISKNYEHGDKIKIKSGPLKNIEGFVLERSEGKLIEIALVSIGQSVKVKLPKEILDHFE